MMERRLLYLLVAFALGCAKSSSPPEQAVGRESTYVAVRQKVVSTDAYRLTCGIWESANDRFSAGMYLEILSPTACVFDVFEYPSGGFDHVNGEMAVWWGLRPDMAEIWVARGWEPGWEPPMRQGSAFAQHPLPKGVSPRIPVKCTVEVHDPCISTVEEIREVPPIEVISAPAN